MRFAYLNLNDVKTLIVSKKETYDVQLLKLLEVLQASKSTSLQTEISTL